MATVEDRLAFVEGRVQEQSQMFAGLRETIASLEQRVDRRFDHVDARFTVLEQKVEALSAKVDRQLDAVRREMSNNQRWLVGLQVTSLLVVIGAIFAR